MRQSPKIPQLLELFFADELKKRQTAAGLRRAHLRQVQNCHAVLMNPRDNRSARGIRFLRCRYAVLANAKAVKFLMPHDSRDSVTFLQRNFWHAVRAIAQ
jgi:hypothetical protein